MLGAIQILVLIAIWIGGSLLAGALAPGSLEARASGGLAAVAFFLVYAVLPLTILRRLGVSARDNMLWLIALIAVFAGPLAAWVITGNIGGGFIALVTNWSPVIALLVLVGLAVRAVRRVGRAQPDPARRSRVQWRAALCMMFPCVGLFFVKGALPNSQRSIASDP